MLLDALLAEDGDLARAIAGLVGADGEEGLYRVIGQAAVALVSVGLPLFTLPHSLGWAAEGELGGADELDLRVDAVASLVVG